MVQVYQLQLVRHIQLKLVQVVLEAKVLQHLLIKQFQEEVMEEEVQYKGHLVHLYLQLNTLVLMEEAAVDHVLDLSGCVLIAVRHGARGREDRSRVRPLAWDGRRARAPARTSSVEATRWPRRRASPCSVWRPARSAAGGEASKSDVHWPQPS